MKKSRDFKYLYNSVCPNKPIVSVLVLTYNHERFIKQAIDSIVCQITNFPYEIVIGEDYSSDTTRAICLEYQKQYPDKIKLLLQNKNKGLIGNFRDTLSVCNGLYIAECAGDDLWGDCYKLQKHVDYMEANKDVIVTYHDAKTINESGTIMDNSYLKECKKDYSNLELKKTAWIIPATMCYRCCVIPELLLYLNKHVYTEDVFMVSLMGNYGCGVYLSNIENSLYRFSQNSIWSMQAKEHKMLLALGTIGELMKYWEKKKDIYLYDFFHLRFMSGLSDLLNQGFSELDKKIYLKILYRYIGYIGLKNYLYHMKNLIRGI